QAECRTRCHFLLQRSGRKDLWRGLGRAGVGIYESWCAPGDRRSVEPGRRGGSRAHEDLLRRTQHWENPCGRAANGEAVSDEGSQPSETLLLGNFAGLPGLVSGHTTALLTISQVLSLMRDEYCRKQEVAGEHFFRAVRGQLASFCGGDGGLFLLDSD